MKPSKIVEKLLSERADRQTLHETARVTSNSDSFVIDVYSDDHSPPHCHFRVSGDRELKLLVQDPTVIWSSPRKGIKKDRLLTWEGLESWKRKLTTWLSQPSKKGNGTNAEALVFAWNLTHPS